jgi:hypothetical protein
LKNFLKAITFGSEKSDFAGKFVTRYRGGLSKWRLEWIGRKAPVKA